MFLNSLSPIFFHFFSRSVSQQISPQIQLIILLISPSAEVTLAKRSQAERVLQLDEFQPMFLNFLKIPPNSPLRQSH